MVRRHRPASPVNPESLARNVPRSLVALASLSPVVSASRSQASPSLVSLGSAAASASPVRQDSLARLDSVSPASLASPARPALGSRASASRVALAALVMAVASLLHPGLARRSNPA